MFDIDPDAPAAFAAGILFYFATIDGAPVRAGITIDAFDQLMKRAGLDPDGDSCRTRDDDIVAVLKPTIEAHLESKHYRQGLDAGPLIVGIADLVTH